MSADEWLLLARATLIADRLSQHVCVCALSQCAMRAASSVSVSLERMLSKRNLLMLHLSKAKAKAKQGAKSARGYAVREDTQVSVDAAITVCKKQ